jgi:hypothetical protein
VLEVSMLKLNADNPKAKTGLNSKYGLLKYIVDVSSIANTNKLVKPGFNNKMFSNPMVALQSLLNVIGRNRGTFWQVADKGLPMTETVFCVSSGYMA